MARFREYICTCILYSLGSKSCFYLVGLRVPYNPLYYYIHTLSRRLRVITKYRFSPFRKYSIRYARKPRAKMYTWIDCWRRGGAQAFCETKTPSIKRHAAWHVVRGLKFWGQSIYLYMMCASHGLAVGHHPYSGWVKSGLGIHVIEK